MSVRRRTQGLAASRAKSPVLALRLLAQWASAPTHASCRVHDSLGAAGWPCPPSEKPMEVRAMTASREVVFLLDVDNTLLDNDRVIADLRTHLACEFDAGSAGRYWAIFETLRIELGYADHLGALQRLRLDAGARPRGETHPERFPVERVIRFRRPSTTYTSTCCSPKPIARRSPAT